jgi:hypothetical protein
VTKNNWLLAVTQFTKAVFTLQFWDREKYKFQKTLKLSVDLNLRVPSGIDPLRERCTFEILTGLHEYLSSMRTTTMGDRQKILGRYP